MKADCYPIESMPGTTRLFRDFVAGSHARLSTFYANPAIEPAAPALTTDREQLADLLTIQNTSWGASPESLANIERLRTGASAMVTGQQVTLFGGPLFTLLKAVTAIRKARDFSAAGHPHVPIFWLASEDHDIAEVNHVTLPAKGHLAQIHLTQHSPLNAPVGNLPLGEGILPALDDATSLLGEGAMLDLLREAYTPTATLAGAFARTLSKIFSSYGLIIIDAATREFHKLGTPVLRAAIEQADELHDALVARAAKLEQLGYHAQVTVQQNSSLLFLIIDGARIALKHNTGSDEWRAGPKPFTTSQLLALLDQAPERFSPNALLRPVFQDMLLPTTEYIGGPAEIAYFAQSAVLYDMILGRKTPVLPRFSATLVEPAIASILARHELEVRDVFTSKEALAQRLAARAIPIEGKKHLGSAGNALNDELDRLLDWMHSMDDGLARAGETSASKMRYQMNRLRRLAANHMLEREASLARHAAALTQSLYPEGHLQERVLGSAYFLARYFDTLPATLVNHPAQDCPGHHIIPL